MLRIVTCYVFVPPLRGGHCEIMMIQKRFLRARICRCLRGLRKALHSAPNIAADIMLVQRQMQETCRVSCGAPLGESARCAFQAISGRVTRAKSVDVVRRPRRPPRVEMV